MERISSSIAACAHRIQTAWAQRPPSTDAILLTAAAAILGLGISVCATLSTKLIILGSSLAACLLYQLFSKCCTNSPQSETSCLGHFLITSNDIFYKPMGEILQALLNWPNANSSIIRIQPDDCTFSEETVPEKFMCRLEQTMKKGISAAWGTSSKEEVFTAIKICNKAGQLAYLVITCPSLDRGEDISVYLLKDKYRPVHIALNNKEALTIVNRFKKGHNLEINKTSYTLAKHD